MRCLLIDNYDSFTWMLADCIGRVFGEQAMVVRNDELSWQELGSQYHFDCIVISPGPGSVTRPDDFNIAAQAVLHAQVPVLGVCLGFHGIAHLHGCRIERAPVPFHGRTSNIYHQGVGLFTGIPSPFAAVRYHSLIVASPLASDIVATAHSDCGVLMALQHRTRPQWGVQFHPESILTEHGLRLLINFRELARHTGARRSVSLLQPPTLQPTAVSSANHPKTALQVHAREIAVSASTEACFAELFVAQPHCFWLDSQCTLEGVAELSFMGAVAERDVIAYRLKDDASGAVGRELLQRLERELTACTVADSIALPFDFRGGFVGYLSYEMKALLGGAQRAHCNDSPDLLWMRVRRFIAIDQVRSRGWVVALASEAEASEARVWLEATAGRIAAIHSRVAVRRAPSLHTVEIGMDFGRDDYLAAIASCQRAISAGESYEICLTNRFVLSTRIDPWPLYVEMRAANPAPFGAFIKSGVHAVLSTSPERFLKVDRSAVIQAKPIKGTAARGDDAARDSANARALANCAKERAENLMIVDLMRSDLSRVAVSGSVRVPVLMAVESYQTVHQLVSTITAELRPECSLVDLLRATFPGGSISGAPKLRTLQLIDELERSPRGVYCGAIGYLGYGRVADLSIAIRTAAYDGQKLRFGAGGAITYLSDASAEQQEMLLKAEAVLRPIWTYLSGSSDWKIDFAQLGTLRLQAVDGRAAIDRAYGSR